MKKNRNIIVAIILIVMAAPLAFGAETFIAPADKMFSPLSIVVMVMNIGAQLMLARSLWTGKTAWASWGGVMFLLSAFFALGLTVPGQFSMGVLVTLSQAVLGAFLAVKYPAGLG